MKIDPGQKEVVGSGRFLQAPRQKMAWFRASTLGMLKESYKPEARLSVNRSRTRTQAAGRTWHRTT